MQAKAIAFMLATALNVIGAAVLASDALMDCEAAVCGINLFILFTPIMLLGFANHLRPYYPWLAWAGTCVNVLVLLLALIGVFGFLTGGA